MGKFTYINDACPVRVFAWVTVIATGMAALPTISHAAAIETILVTARKRTEQLDAVPQSITVLTQQNLDRLGITTSPDVAHQVPSMTWNSILGLDTPQIFLRGIGNATYNANQANPVAVHVDGVYQGSNIVYGAALFDLDRVEVLKGPQGTLFGRNTTGGVVNFIAHKPDVHEGTNGTISLTKGRFDQTDINGALGFAIGDHVAVRISAMDLNRDGYVVNRNPAVSMPNEGRVDLWSARGQVRFQDVGNLDLLLSVHGGRNRSDTPPGKQIGVICPAGTGVPSLGACTDFFGFRDTANTHENFTNIPSYDFVDNWGGAATATWSLEHFDVVSQTAFEWNSRKIADDTDGGPVAAIKVSVLGNFHQVSQELRVVSHNDSRLTWLVGGNFYSDRFYANQAYTLNAYGPGGISHFFPVEEGIESTLTQNTRSFAGFGEASFRLTDRLTLTAGTRWTRDRRSADPSVFIFNATGFSTAFVDLPTASARLLVPTIPAMHVMRSWGKWSGRGSVSYAVTNDLLAYVQVSRGFKGGDFNGGALFAPAEATITNPEYVTAYEIGAKGSAFDRRLTYSGAAYLYNFTDQQVAVLVPGSNATLQSLANAAKTRVKGVEAEVAATPMTPLYLEAKAGYTDAKFLKFQLDTTNATMNFDGNRTPSSPKFTFSGVARYTVPLGDNALSVQFDTSYTSAQFFTVDNNPSLRQSGYWLENARVTFATARFDIGFWVKNLSDHVYFVSGLANTGLGFIQVYPGLPRTYGATVSAKF